MANCRMVLKIIDGRMIAIDIIAGEDKVAGSTYQRSKLDYLTYNEPVEYA